MFDFKRYIVLSLFLFAFINSRGQLKLLSTDVIWNNKNYSAFTSLIILNGQIYCAFREATSHRATADPLTWGSIRIIKSTDFKRWELVTCIKEENADLRDPKLSMSPDKKMLILVYCKREFNDKTQGPPTTRIAIFRGGDFQNRILKKAIIKKYRKSKQWLWGITWHKNIAYGFVYGNDFMLVKTKNGIKYSVVAKMKPGGDTATEACIAFRNDTAFAVARGKQNIGYYGISIDPYKKWEWKKMNMKIAGPALINLSDNSLLLGTRNYSDAKGKTSLYKLSNNSIIKIMTLPSDIDSSYPSFAMIGDKLYVSYYSGKNGYADIYLSKIQILN